MMLQKIIFIVILALCATPLISPPVALLLGLLLAQTIGCPFAHLIHRTSKVLLKISVVGLGFGMNLYSAIETSSQGMILIVGSIALTLLLGMGMGKILKVNSITALLISVGTAICGGSAIAAVSPIVKAKAQQMTIALGTVFILNAVALFLFPYIGNFLEMSQQSFGLWIAIAIHDISSVVGAAQMYGEEALDVAVTIKLARTLWIIPIVFGVMVFTKEKKQRFQFPWFILGFILAMMINTFIAETQFINSIFVNISKQLLVMTLFLIGAGLSKKNIQSVGVRPFVLGILLWLIISGLSLFVIH